MAGVQVTFGANIQGLVDGVTAVKEQIAGLGEAAQALIGAFAGGATAEFIDKMAALGDQIEGAAAMLGASVRATQEFGYAAKMTGGDAQSMATAMERFEVSLQRAQNPTSQQALALKALGLSAKELIGLPLEQQMDKFADAVSRFADGPGKTAAVGAINRGFVQMIPLLDQGSSGLQALRDRAEETGAVMTGQTVTALGDLDHQIIGARASLTAMAGTLTALAAKTLGDFADGVATSAGHLTALGSTGNLADYVLGYLGEVVDNLGFRFVQLGHAIANITTLNFKGLQEQWATDEAALIGNAAAEGHSLDAILNQSIESYKKLLAAQAESNKPKVGAIDVGGADALKAQMEQYQAMIKVADEQYKQTQEHLGAEAKLHEITYSQETQQLLAALDVRRAAETAATDGELALYARGTAGYEKVLATRKEQDAKYFADRQKIVDQAAEREAQEWQKAGDQVAGAFNSQLLKMLQGKESWAKASKQITADLVLKEIEDQVKLTAEWLANQARMLAAKLAAETGMTTATTAGAALRSAAEVASGQTSIFAVIADAMKSIYASGGKAGAEVAAAVAPEAGPAAPAIGAAAGAAVIAVGTGLAAFDVGTDFVMRSGLAVIHRGEQIKPAVGSGPYTGKSDGVSGAVRSMLSAHADTIKGMLGTHARSMASLESEVWQMRRAVARATR